MAGVIDEKIAERRRAIREGRRRSRLRRTVTVAVLVALLVAFLALERSALVGLEEIRVLGAERVDEEVVRAATELELGTSTLRLRLGRVEERVARLPAVRVATARRLDPLTVLIEVVEREPRLVAESEGRRALVDREGVLLDDGRQGGLPRILIDDGLPEIGSTVSEDAALENAFRAWRGLTGPLRTEVVRYDAAGVDDLVLQLESGIAVRFGRAHRIDEKVRALGVILEDIEDAEISEIDVRAPSSPVVVP